MKIQPNTSISQATMRPEDLIPRFLEALETYGFSAITDRAITPEACKATHAEITARMAEPGYFDSEASCWDLEALFDTLGLLAPEGCYFGAHPGDGSDYGFWGCDLLDPFAEGGSSKY